MEAPGTQPTQQRTCTVGVQEMREFHEIFAAFKTLCRREAQTDEEEDDAEIDIDSPLTPDELEHLIESIGLKLSPEEIKAMIDEVDTDGNGKIDFEEFCNVMNKDMQVDKAPEELQQAFKAFARNAPDGYIKVKDLRNALATYMHKDVSDFQVNQLISHYSSSFVKLPGCADELFHYQDYLDLMHEPVISPT
eukprot:gnl/TRDRNA2_/TRDRNA2_135514_c0_seq1.p1 gnl/TRDRNA2_/TRDRNA2_135514_c0~~gnl/TRDRNA2_/TRDRNA2_135514_c0_seq1.p1  ORF type:complete len:215 (+),score=51.61 gnl/TRDRNA2_/TRDRNA2_135514_c0_seq1:72-647(+)